jgi:hypothetical protein
MEKFISKDEIKRFIKYLTINQEQFNLDDDFKLIITNATNLNDAYKELGNNYSSMSTNYKNVLFKEDLFEILIKKYDYDFTVELTDCVSNGNFKNFKHKEKFTHQFRKWAYGVNKLSSRESILNLNSNLYEQFSLKNPYNKLKDKDLLKEIRLTIMHNNFSSINSIQSTFGIGFNRTMELLEELFKLGYLVKFKNTYKYEGIKRSN